MSAFRHSMRSTSCTPTTPTWPARSPTVATGSVMRSGSIPVCPLVLADACARTRPAPPDRGGRPTLFHGAPAGGRSGAIAGKSTAGQHSDLASSHPELRIERRRSGRSASASYRRECVARERPDLPLSESLEGAPSQSSVRVESCGPRRKPCSRPSDGAASASWSFDIEPCRRPSAPGRPGPR